MEIFIGRFHPLIVHLPIGFIMLGFIFETLAFFWKSLKGLQRTVPYMYLAAFLVSIASVSSGWMLSENGAYAPGDLGIHKWMAISTMILSLVLALLKWDSERLKPKVSYGLSIVLIAFVSITGHYGGVLTHGNDYLYEYAPGWVQSVAGFEAHDDLETLSKVSPDSILMYADVVKPILEARCVRCHNDDEPSGGFNADHYQTLFEEGETGTPVVAGNPSSSEMFLRVSLPTTSVKFMPPNGHPMSYTELSVIRHWIAQGADSAARFDHASMSDELAQLVKRDYSLDFTPKPYYEKIAVDSLSPEIFESLATAGFQAKYLGGDNYLLDVKFLGDTLPEGSLSRLQEVGENVTFLDLSELVLEDPEIDKITSFPNLTRLDLHGSNISNDMFSTFENLEHLEVLNVFKTEVAEDGLKEALSSPSLKRVYIWQTSVSDEAADRLATEYPDIQFDRGFTFVKPDTTANTASN